MITEERLRVFLNSLDCPNPDWLNDLEARARADGVPVIRTETQNLLKFFLTAARPESILEIGAAVGFSALFMSEYMPDGCRITTMENYEKRILEARRNIQKAGRQEVITLLEGDAARLLPELSGPYDFIFMDAAKGQYLNFLPETLRLLKSGGYLLSDNVLKEGDILESRYAVARRDRTIHKRMRDYLYELTHHCELTTVVLPVGDGVTVSVRNLR